MKSFTVLLIALALVFGGAIGWWGGSTTQNAAPKAMNTPNATTSSKATDLKIAMRKLWEDHITWTRLYLVDFANGSAMADSDATRLLKNQEDLGNAIKPYYGDDAGNQLTTLLKTHITGAVALVKAAKANDTTALNKANTDWYNNGQQIADFLAKANPKWSDADLRSMMKSHLDLTKQEAVDILDKKYDASVGDYDKVHDEILQMSDALSTGIVRQYPNKF
ncbi:MAG TPA: hypothetical protein VEW42_02925 [Candidatus Eisenbacteria bacterium]|nr:hypothetical protein [Candidatus Eisenbacteria bacterium]